MSDDVTAAEPSGPEPGSTVGPWLLLECLNSGSFGIVYRAQRAGHPDSPPVALKLARTPKDPRFLREAELLQRCQHPNIPRYEDQGMWTGPRRRKYPYVVMEWVEGLTLYDWAEDSARTSREVLQVVQQLASALATAHSRGAFHRDVKGGNIRVTAEGRAVLVDWGSGWFAGAHPLTDTTAPPGTMAYRPPEQRRFQWWFRKDKEARWHSTAFDDLYSLGVTLYRLVTGVYLPPCTEGGRPVEREVLKPSAMATVCLELEELILWLISDDRHARGTAEQLAEECATRVQTGGPALDLPIRPTESEPVRAPSSSPSSMDRSPPGPAVPIWLTWAAASALGAGLMAALVLLLVRPAPPEAEPNPTPWLATPEEVARFAPDAGVADEALASAHSAQSAGSPYDSLGAPLPKQPYPQQRKPPCERGQREINKGCWVEVGREKPPCGDKMFDYEDYCYLPAIDMPRAPTSGTP